MRQFTDTLAAVLLLMLWVVGVGTTIPMSDAAHSAVDAPNVSACVVSTAAEPGNQMQSYRATLRTRQTAPLPMALTLRIPAPVAVLLGAVCVSQSDGAAQSDRAASERTESLNSSAS